MNRLGYLALACSFAATGSVVAAGDAATEAGVRDAENRWSEAFISGDARTLDALLDADYVSTATNGRARSKADIIRIAGAYAKDHPGEHAKQMAPSSTIRVIGDAAVVQHHGDSDMSVDVFYYRDGRWHAWYSQHTKVGT